MYEAADSIKGTFKTFFSYWHSSLQGMEKI